MILYGLVGEYLKTNDFGILGTGAAISLHLPHQLMIYFGALVFGGGLIVSIVGSVIVFVLRPVSS